MPPPSVPPPPAPPSSAAELVVLRRQDDPFLRPERGPYPAATRHRLSERLNRVTTLFRIVSSIPIALVYGILVGGNSTVTERPTVMWSSRRLRALGADLRRDAADAAVPEALPEMVVRLCTRTHSVRDEGGCVRGAADRHVSIDRRRTASTSRSTTRRRAGPDARMPLVKWFLRSRTTSCCSSWGSRLLRRRLRVVRDLVHRPVPEGAFDYVVGVGPMGSTGTRLRVPARDRSVPPFQLSSGD